MTTFEKITAACRDLAGANDISLTCATASPDLLIELSEATGAKLARAMHVGHGEPAVVFESISVRIAGTYIRMARSWPAERGEPVDGYYCRDRGFQDATVEEINAAFQEGGA
jgi:hypothetical protein